MMFPCILWLQEHLWSHIWSWWSSAAFLLSLWSSPLASTPVSGLCMRLPESVPCLKVRDDVILSSYVEKLGTVSVVSKGDSFWLWFLQVSASPLLSSPSCFPHTTMWSCAGPSFTCLTRLGRPSPGCPATTPGILWGTVPVDFTAATTLSCSRPANSSLSKTSCLCTSADHFWNLSCEVRGVPFLSLQSQGAGKDQWHWRTRWPSLGTVWLPPSWLGHHIFVHS